MEDTIRRLAGIGGGLVIVTAIALSAAGALAGDRGVPGPLLLLGGFGTAILTLAILALMVGVAILVCRAVNTAVGIFVLGWGVGILSMRGGTVLDVLFGGIAPGTAAIETLLWTLPVLAASWALFRFGGVFSDVHSDRPGLSSAVESRAVLACLVAVVAIPVAWVVLRNPLKGQAIAAAVLGGLACGVFGRTWSPRTQPLLLVAAPVAILGAVQLLLALRVDAPIDSYVAGTYHRLLWMTPLDVVAGSLAGVALGLGWARSFIREPHELGEGSLRPDAGRDLLRHARS